VPDSAHEGRVSAVARPILGIGGKSLHAEGRETSPISSRITRGSDPSRSAEHRRILHELTRAAGSLLYRPDVPVPDQHATCWCHRGLQRDRLIGERDPSIWRRRDGSGARVDGVITCGNVWTCPVCATSIRAQRREELEIAAKVANDRGLYRYLLTLTFPHQRTDNLADILDRLSKARQRFRNSRAYKRIMTDAGRVGSVCALEVTWSPMNGWHPHTHDLVFANRRGLGEGAPDDAGNLSSPAIDELKSAWLHCLDRAGLLPGDKVSDAWAHALNVRGGQYAADYIAKYGREESWSLSRELTEHLAKLGRGDDHVTPFQILDRARRGDDTAAALFVEYAAAFKGRRALTWTPGLKRDIGLAEVADEEAANRPEPNEHQVGHLSHDQFAMITSRAAMGELLQMIALYGAEDGQQVIDEWCAVIASRPRSHTGAIIKRHKGSAFVRADDGPAWRKAACVIE
jgi:hypothetical protein